MLGLQAQYQDDGPSTIADDGVIPFNVVVNDQSVDLTLNAVNGEITISSVGNYYVSWSIAVDGSTVAPFITFTLTVDGTPVASSTTAALTDLLSGSALITVAAVPAILRLVNTTGNDTFTADTAVQANIVILQLA